MAIHHFLLEGPMFGPVGMSARLHFDGSVVTVEWKRQTVTMPAAVGDVIFVDCWGGVPRLGKTTPPKRLDRLALWLVGVPRESRFPTKEAAERNFEKTRHETAAWWEETVRRYNPGATPPGFRAISGERWYVGQYRDASTDWRNVCGWVASDVTPSEVREFVDLIGSRWSRK